MFEDFCLARQDTLLCLVRYPCLSWGTNNLCDTKFCSRDGNTLWRDISDCKTFPELHTHALYKQLYPEVSSEAEVLKSYFLTLSKWLTRNNV